MQDLVKQEQFELEVLDRLNTCRVLPRLIFGGGTMLRLCYGLNRFSVDLDFWLRAGEDPGVVYNSLREGLSSYTVTDAADKFHTILFELRTRRYPRALKIEIRKEHQKVSVEQAIAFSRFSQTQVRVNTVSLPDMMNAKLEALVNRKEIRDAFDLEFLLKKGIQPLKSGYYKNAAAVIRSFTKNDYRVKLGSLLEADDRQYYMQENFKQLLAFLKGD